MKFLCVCVLALASLLLACADASACFRPFGGFFAGRRAAAVVFVPATPAPMAVPQPMPAKPAPVTPAPAAEPKKTTAPAAPKAATPAPTVLWSSGPVTLNSRTTVVRLTPAPAAAGGEACPNGQCPAAVVVPARRGLFGWR